MIRKTLATAKTKKYDIELKSALVTKDAADNCIIEGYANTSSKDRVGDVVMPKAFEKTLAVYMANPVLLANHDWNDPCGVVLNAEITDKGLWIKARISNTREDIKTLIREGCLRTFSIGYNEIDCDYDESTKTKYIKELELLEISVVTVPANTEAMFTTASEKTDAEGAEKADDSAKSAPKAHTASELVDFINMVKSVVNRELESTETVALCDYFINETEGNHMTKDQLIAALKVKSAKDAAVIPAPAQTDAKADAAAPAEGQAQDAGQDPMKEMMAKLDAIGQALAQILEGMKQDESEDAAEDAQPEDKPADAAPADQGKADAQPAADEEEMSDEDCQKQLAEIDAEIQALEDSEEA